MVMSSAKKRAPSKPADPCLICLKECAMRGMVQRNGTVTAESFNNLARNLLDKPLEVGDNGKRKNDIAGAEASPQSTPVSVNNHKAEEATAKPNENNNDSDSDFKLLKRFLLFNKRYLKTRSAVDTLLQGIKEWESQSAKKSEPSSILSSKIFCPGCYYHVRNICELYEELQLVELRLGWRLTNVENDIKSSSEMISVFLVRAGNDEHIYNILRKKLNVDSGRAIKVFRQALKLTCKKKMMQIQEDSEPKVVVHRGLSPEEWKFTYKEAKYVLMRLIIVFALASNSKPLKSKKPVETMEMEVEVTAEECDADNYDADINSPERCDDLFNTRRPRRTKRKIHVDEESDFSDENNEGVHDGNDSDWSAGSIRCNDNISPVNDDIVTTDLSEDDDDSDSELSEDSFDEECDKKKQYKSVLKPKSTKRNGKAMFKIVLLCSSCDKKFYEISEFTDHCTSVHSMSPDAIFCKFCGMHFDETESLNFHKEDVHRIVLVESLRVNGKKCDECGTTLTRLRRHLKNIHSIEIEWILADGTIGGTSLDPQRKSENKEKKQKPEGDLPDQSEKVKKSNIRRSRCILSCPQCEETFTDIKEYSEHVRITHNLPDVNFCDICGWTFGSDADEVINHKRNFHKIKNSATLFDGKWKWKKCVECDKKFTTPQTFTYHLRATHKINFETPENAKMIKSANVSNMCSMCHRIFPDKVELFRHLISNYHTHFEQVAAKTIKAKGKGLNACHACLQEFTDEEEIRAHLYSHQTETIREHCCEACLERFFTNEELEIHLTEVHQNLFTCYQCGTKCNSGQNLRNHLEMHETGETTHLCFFCGRGFTSKQYFELHKVITHMNPTRLFCDNETCTEEFATLQDLNIHMQGHVNKDSNSNIGYCKVCTRGFFNRFSLIFHDICHEPQNPDNLRYECPICNGGSGVFCSSLGSFLLHFLSRHNGGATTTTLSCSECGDHFDSTQSLNEHIEKHKAESGGHQYQCYECDKVYLTKDGLTKHLSLMEKNYKHSKILSVGFLCDHTECTTACKTLDLLYEHLKSHVAEGEDFSKRIQRCSTCNWPFINSEFLGLHQLLHIKKGDDGMYKCEECLENFISAKCVLSHANKIHRGKINFYKCYKCGHSFLGFKHLREHWKRKCEETTDGPNEIRFSCPTCIKVFTLSCTLRSHMRLCHGHKRNNAHSDNTNGQQSHSITREKKRFVCETCGFRCALRSQLTRHKLSHTGESKYKCDQCMVSFRKKHSLNDHIRRKHTPNPASFVCDECGKVFTTDCGLKYHRDSIHRPHSERRFGCDNCGRRFTRSFLFKNHMKVCQPTK